MKAFTSLAPSGSRALRRSSICGALSRPSPTVPCLNLSTTARRLSVEANKRAPPACARRASLEASPARRASVDITPRTAGWNIPISTFPREITWLAGAPGAGKGTNSTFIANARGYRAPTIVMSTLLESPECKRIKDAGGMVDDATVQRALLKELAKPEYRDGVVVDGFPRTQKQAEWLSSLHDTLSTPISPVNFNFVMLFVDEELSVARQLSRGESIRQLNTIRSTNGLEPLEERATDVSADAARVRYSNFVQQYDAINKLSARFSLSVVDASAPIEAVRNRIATTLKPTTSSTITTQQKTRQHRFASLDTTSIFEVDEKAYAYA